MSSPASPLVAPQVQESRPEPPAWLQELRHYDPDYPYNTDRYEYTDWSTTDPYYIEEDVRLSPGFDHSEFLRLAEGNLRRWREIGHQTWGISRELPIWDLPDTPLARRSRRRVEPDLALWPPDVVLKGRKSLSWLQDGSPVFVLEVLSDSTRTKDHRDNPQLYDAMGVKEYWICDPETMRWVAVYQWEGEGPLTQVDLDGKTSLYSPVLQTTLRVHAEKGLQCQDPDTNQWIELITSVRQEGRVEGRVEERMNSLLDLARTLTDETQVTTLEEELAHTPFDQWPTVSALYWRYTQNPDGTP